jgi:hypothetical protein
MLISVLASCVLLTAINPPGDESKTAQPDLAGYQAAKSHVGRDANAQVKLALWCEDHGLSAERVKHLTLATLIDPSNSAARGLLGLVLYQGKWQRPDDISRRAKDDPTRSAALQEYLQRRARTPDKADEQWKLALWCDQNGLKQQAIAHLYRVISLDPKRDVAWKRLGYRKQNGRWILPELVAAEKAENDAQTSANKLWKPRLEHWRDALFGRDMAKKAAAEASMSQISDPRAVPMIWALFARGDEAHQRVALNTLSQIDAPGASRALALLGVFSPSVEIRRSAAEILRRRDARDFAGLLVGLMRDPIKYKVKPVGGAGGQGELFVEGKDANFRRLYTPSALPTVLPGDQLGMDFTGMPVITRVLGSYWTPATLSRRFPSTTDHRRHRSSPRTFSPQPGSVIPASALAPL